MINRIRDYDDAAVRASELAQILGISKRTIYSYVHKDILPPPLPRPAQNSPLRWWLSDVKAALKTGHDIETDCANA